MELQIYTHDDLTGQNEHDSGNEFGMDIWRKLATLVFMPQEVPYDRQDGSCGLNGNVELGADYLERTSDTRHLIARRVAHSQHHSCREKDPPCQSLNQDMDP